MNEIHLNKYDRITINLKDGQVVCGLEHDLKTGQWFALIPSTTIGVIAAHRQELTANLIDRIVEQTGGTIFLDLSGE